MPRHTCAFSVAAARWSPRPVPARHHWIYSNISSLPQPQRSIAERVDALAAETLSGAEAYRDGIELILKQLQELLRKRGVTPIHSLGTDFDPNVHQAIAHEASERHREGEVIGELQRGYRLGSRLLREAMVKVAKREQA